MNLHTIKETNRCLLMNKTAADKCLDHDLGGHFRQLQGKAQNTADIFWFSKIINDDTLLPHTYFLADHSSWLVSGLPFAACSRSWRLVTFLFFSHIA